MSMYDEAKEMDMIQELYDRIAEVIDERDVAQWSRDQLKEENEELKEMLYTYKGLWIDGESTIGFLRKKLYEAHRDLEVAELRLKVIQLEESNSRLRECREEV